jgi:hypothetical protein
VAEYYIAPSYRGFSIMHDDIYEGKKRYGIIDYKGKEKKIRLWDKPQAGWKETSPIVQKVDPLSKPHYEEVNGCMRVVGLKENTLAQLLGFGEQGYIQLVVLKEANVRQDFWKWTSINGLKPFIHNRMIGIYLPEGIDPPKEFIPPLVKLYKNQILIDDNTFRPRQEILDTVFEARGEIPQIVTYSWEFTSPEALENYREKRRKEYE